jgi:hypothetical protein
MADIKAGVLLSLKDQFSQGIKGAGASVKDFGSTALGAVEKVNKAFSGIAGTLATVGVTIGVGAAVKTYIDLDDRMVRLGTDIGASADKTNDLKRRLYEVAQDPSIKMGTDSLLEAMEAFSGKNYDADFITDNLHDVGLAMKATGASGGDMANLFMESYKRGMDKDDILKSLNDISVIGDKLHGGYNISTFSQALPGLEAVNNLLGKSAMNTTQLYTAMNILNQGTKSPAKAMSAFSSIVNELADPKKQETLHRIGINVRDMETGNFRDLADILKDIAATDGGTGNFDTLSTVFSSSAMDAIFAYNQFGHLADGLEDLGDTSGEIQKKAASNASSLKANLGNLQTAFMSFADKNLTVPLQKLTELMNRLSENPEKIEKAIKGIAIALAALGAIKIGAGVVSFIANLKGIQGGKINLAGAAGGGAGIPVHVTNWGGGSAGASSLPGNSGAGLPQVKNTGVPGLDIKANNAALLKSGAMKAGMLQAAAVGVQQGVNAFQEVKAINTNEELSNKEKGKQKGAAIGTAVGTTVGTGAGVFAGALLAGKVGAMIGTAIAPGVGTAIGGAIGMLGGAAVGWIGGKLGKKAGEAIGEAVAKEDIPKTLQNEMKAVPRLPEQKQSVALEGNAVMDVNVTIGEDRTRVFAAMRQNTTPMRFNTGLAQESRGLAQ